ncbi:glycosyltransferase family 39 protein [Paenibacillus sp. 32352]|uniref:ArnT family glycosyltransferase n=1 Tax=Paenibacillus sp. 32352 TaxID=1969111 RepID=UPI0009AE70D7|nr:glycosyltransferase family 39 protein [Paenibacillus sp. 32352]
MKQPRTRFQHIDAVLLLIAALSAFLNIFNIWKEKYVNAYYTSAVQSMLQSFHNFFYASFDPAGYVTVDKPPVTFWIQTLSAALFGLHGWSVILPQALAGVGSVLLLYCLVKPSFGKGAARISALVMACTPVATAVARTNNVDSLLVFTLLVAAWMLFRAVRRQQAWWVLAAFAVIGIGFNMKMMQAYMVVPAFGLFYLLAFKVNWKKKAALLAGAAAALLLVSLSWPVIVDSIPKEDRPYIGSSQTNSVLELAFGYNGIQRLTGKNRGSTGPSNAAQDRNLLEQSEQQSGSRFGNPSVPGLTRAEGSAAITPNQPEAGSNVSQSPNRMDDSNSATNQNQPGGMMRDGNGNRGQMPSSGDGGGRLRSGGSMGDGGPMGGGGPGGGGMFGTGSPGPLRLFQSGLSGQISWLIPLAAIGCVGLLGSIRRKSGLTPRHKETIFWLAWLIPGMIFFSIAGFFHQYYLIMLAPPIAALTGAGWIALWNLYKAKSGWTSWLLPASVLAATALEVVILYENIRSIHAAWLYGVGTAGLAATLVLVLIKQQHKSYSYYAALASLLILLAAPLYWTATPILYGQNSKLPEAGPQASGSGRGGMPMGGDDQINAGLLSYVTRHNTGETFLFGTTNATTAAPYIIESGKAVMAMGGYSGSDPIMTVDRLKQMVADKQIKYFLLPSGGGFGGGTGGQGGSSEVLQWIKDNSQVVPSSEWQTGASSDTDTQSFSRSSSLTLYEINVNG